MHELLTIVIPTYNRPHSLDQVLAHISEFDVRIIILDSTATPHPTLSQSERVQYVHCPEQILVAKLRQHVAELVETPYMLMNADDIFPLQIAVKQSLDFLEKNPDYSSAQGVVVNYNQGRLYPHVYDSYLFPVDSDHAGVRLLQHHANYYPIFYALQRTDSWKTALRRQPENLVNYTLLEHGTTLMHLIHGKSARFDTPFYVVNLLPPEDKCLRLRGNAKDHISNPRYFPELEALKRAATQYMGDKEGIPANAARRYVEDAIALLFIWSYDRNAFYWLGDRPPKTMKDRLRREWESFLRKVLGRKRPAPTVATASGAPKKTYMELLLERSGEDTLRELESIKAILKG
ncbi:TIGR00180 family glycosyltransferase [Pseudodesulfovibrio sp.]|uniref:TIGR00180 family glycosyltransferase n=1 Tax=unclassified Pseudodesulfovibrio TaxID=2661612 RepID=UPI003AFFCBFC